MLLVCPGSGIYFRRSSVKSASCLSFDAVKNSSRWNISVNTLTCLCKILFPILRKKKKEGSMKRKSTIVSLNFRALEMVN